MIIITFYEYVVILFVYIIIFVINKCDYINFVNKMRVIQISKTVYLYSSFYYEQENNIILFGYSKCININNLKCFIKIYNNSYIKCNISYNILKRINNNFLVMKIVMNNYYKLKHVVINNKEFHPLTVKEKRNKYNCTVCITKFINYTAETYLLEAFTSYKLIGIDHIVIYYLSSSVNVTNILKYFEKSGFLDIIKWNYHHETINLKEFIYGQLWKYNDCLYRYKKHSNLMLFNDIDEVLWSNNYKLLQEIILQENLILYDVLYLYNRIFRKEFYSNNNYKRSRFIPYDRYNHIIPDFSMFKYHNSCIYDKGYLNKYIIRNFSKINYIRIHDVTIHNNDLKTIYINSSILFLRHTRRVREDLLFDCKYWTNYYSDKENYIINITKILRNSLYKRKLNYNNF